MNWVVILLLLTSLKLCFADDSTNATLLIQGAGSSLPSRLYQDALFAYRYVKPDLEVSYTAVDSDRGICRLESYATECDPTDTMSPTSVDFAGVSTALGDMDYQKYPDIQLYPVLVMAIVPVYNLGKTKTLALTRTALAQIFCGEIRVWDDPRIVATNPDFASWGIPKNKSITVVVRDVSSETTFLFKKALASFYPAFDDQVPIDTSPSWGPLNPILASGYVEANSYVMNNRYAIAYAEFGQAKDFQLPIAKMSRITSQVDASVTSITYAVLELGLNFGNNNDTADHMTADLFNARGLNSWPIVSYTYVAIRKSTLRTGATCQHVRETTEFWMWFLTSDVATSMAVTRNYVPLPSVVRDIVTARMKADVTCNDTPVYVSQQVAQILGYGKRSMSLLFQRLSEVYGLVNEAAVVTYRNGRARNGADVQGLLQNYTFVAFNYASPRPVPDAAVLTYAGVGMVVISTYDFVIDAPTLLRILTGQITTWLHPDLQDLNPDGIRDSNGNLIEDPNTPITVVMSSAIQGDSFLNVMSGLGSPFDTAVLVNATTYSDEKLLRFAVASIRGSLSVTIFVDTFPELKIARFKRQDGHVVTASWQAIRDCASPDVFDKATNSFTLCHSAVPTCYPVSETIYLTAKKSQCNLTTDAARTETVQFLEWLWSGASDSALTQINVAPLRDVSTAVEDANQKAAEYLTCNITADPPVPLGPIIGGSLAGLAALAVAAVIYMWRATRQLRAIRKQFSNDNVAQECAAAIARFDLEAVAWLNDLPKPNRIQMSFIRIVKLLTEVRPFIPDQLLSALQNAVPPPEEGASDAEAPLQPSSMPGSITTVQSMTSSVRTSVPSQSSHNSQRSPNYQPSTTKPSMAGTSDSESDKTPSAARRSRSTLRMRHLASGRRNCTFMYIKFGFGDYNLDDKNVSAMNAATAHIVTLAKTHGATVDKVLFDVVTLHWGVAGVVAGSPLKATTLALELSKMKDALAFEDVVFRTEPFRVAIGIGYGICNIATVSAAGQRFYVTGGRPVSLIANLVNANLHSTVLCSVLISASVQQEVQYSAKCFPRVWFGDVLFWEPLKLRGSDSQGDEWMYELETMKNQDNAGFSPQVLLDVFLMVHNSHPVAAIRDKVRTLKSRYGMYLTTQDKASLDHLLPSH